MKKILPAFLLVVFSLAVWDTASAAEKAAPSVLSIRDRAALVLQIVQKRLDTLVPRMMRETGFDMWIISCNEDNLDPDLRDHDALRKLVPDHPDPGLLRPGRRTRGSSG